MPTSLSTGWCCCGTSLSPCCPCPRTHPAAPLTLHRPKADGEQLHLLRLLRKVHCRPHPCLVVARVLLQLHPGHDCGRVCVEVCACACLCGATCAPGAPGGSGWRHTRMLCTGTICVHIHPWASASTAQHSTASKDALMSARPHACMHVCKRSTILDLLPRPPAHTYVVGAYFQRLVLPHEQADLLVLLVLQQLDDAQPALLPLVAGAIVPVQLALPADGC